MESGLHRFDGKVVIVTAAGGTGTGGTLVRRLLSEGASVFASDMNEGGIEALADSVAERDAPRLRTRRADVTSEEDMRAVVTETIGAFGRLDVLCNHAGGGPSGRVIEVSPEDWREQIDTTLTSVYLLSRCALPYLIESKGCIVNTASISGMGGDWGLAGYTAAKGGVINLTRTMAVEYGADGVRVNGVAPGGVYHPATAELFDSVSDEYLSRVPLGRWASPDDVAAAITFLASADASYITGQILVVDGGISADNGQLNFVPIWRERGLLRSSTVRLG
jgi:meso-butanediol dehydrogenase / (S,S)-butanediol dehydrogenase / diacetyl reductase